MILEAVVTALADEQAALTHMLEGRPDADWQRPSRCAGWTVADVMLHLAQTNEMAIASVDDRFPEYLDEVGRRVAAAGQSGTGLNVDDTAAVFVAAERDRPLDDLKVRWHRSVDNFLDRLKGADLHRRVTWVAGQLSLRTLVATRLAETWIHAGDVAYGLGVDVASTDRLQYIARLAWRTLPYAFARAGRELSGPVAFELRAPDGDRWDFASGEPVTTTIRGGATELCLVAARRLDAKQTSLAGDGPDADAVLEVVRTYA